MLYIEWGRIDGSWDEIWYLTWEFWDDDYIESSLDWEQ